MQYRDPVVPRGPQRSGTGANLGKAIAKTAKKVAKQPSVRKSRRSSGGTVGRTVGRVLSGGSRRSSSGGGSRRSSGGSSGGGSSSKRRGNISVPKAPRPNAPVKPPIPGIDAYLGTDSAYQNALRSGKASLADFLSEMGRRRGEAGTQFTQTSAGMERDRTTQLEDLKNEFASRGLINSGLYGEEQGRFQQQFTDQFNALKQQQASLLADLLSQETGYKRENQQALEIAKQQALARRASKYSIG